MPVPPTEEKLERSSARMLVFNKLREWIETGQLQPGERIKDVDLAARLGISRTPVREALQMLEQIGCIETAPGVSTVVAGVGPEDAVLVYPPLAVLHALAAELATPVLSARDIKALANANERIPVAVEERDPVAAREADYDFHSIFVEKAANPFLSMMIETVGIHARRVDGLYFSHTGPALDSYRDHQKIVDAVRRKDSVAAFELVRKNFMRKLSPDD